MAKLNLILLCVFAFALTNCKSYQDISVSDVESFHLNKMTKDEISAEIKMKIKNPNSVGFSIYPSQFDITYSGVRLGVAKLKKRVKIRKNSEEVYTFNLNSNLSEFNPLDLLQLLNGKSLGTVDVKGDLKAGKLLIRKRFPINHHEKVNIFN